MTARLPAALLAAVLAVSGLARAATPEAMAYLDNALAILRSEHINSARADWPAIIAAAHERARNARTAADTHAAIEGAIEALGERHSHFIAPPPTASPSPPPSGVARGPDSAGAQPDPLMPLIRLAAGHTGYVSLPGLNTPRDGAAAGQRYSTTLREGLQRLDPAVSCGWIVDLRENTGGNMWPMMQGLDPLLGEGPFGSFKLKDGALPWRRTVQGIAPLRPNDPGGAAAGTAFAIGHAGLPVAVLIGPKTASSGEMTAIAFIGREGVRTFGRPSANFTTANAPRALSDGAFLIVTTSKVADRTGQVYEGAIVPDVDSGSGDAAAMALEWLEGSCRT